MGNDFLMVAKTNKTNLLRFSPVQRKLFPPIEKHLCEKCITQSYKNLEGTDIYFLQSVVFNTDTFIYLEKRGIGYLSRSLPDACPCGPSYLSGVNESFRRRVSPQMVAMETGLSQISFT